VLLNFDRLGGDVKADSLMGITALKGDSVKPSYGSVNKGSSWDFAGNSTAESDLSQLHQDHISNRYVFVAKDMPKEMKLRHPDVDIFVAKHIAGAFGMRKGSQVVLVPVCATLPIAKSLRVISNQ
jgi:DEP domain-containing protein 5